MSQSEQSETTSLDDKAIDTHIGVLADEALKSIGARAMTMDGSIFVSEGLSNDNIEDQALYAHERLHQEGSGGHADNNPANDPEELAARAVEQMVLRKAELGEDFGNVLKDSEIDHFTDLGAVEGSASNPGALQGYWALRSQGFSNEDIQSKLSEAIVTKLNDGKDIGTAQTGAESGEAELNETQPFVSLEDAIRQFAQDRDILREQDPEAEQILTQAANHPNAEAMFVNLHESGVKNLPAEALDGDTPKDRVQNILLEVRDVEQKLEREASHDLHENHTSPANNFQAEEELDYGL